MRVALLLVVLFNAVVVNALQIPLELLTRSINEEAKLNVSDIIDILNQISGSHGAVLSAKVNNVTLHYGDRHLSYEEGRIVLSNESEMTTWQIAYDNRGDKFSVCALLPPRLQRCWDSGTGTASVGQARAARYTSSILDGKLLFIEGSYCLARLGGKDYLEWSTNSQCIRLTIQQSSSRFASAHGITPEDLGAKVMVDEYGVETIEFPSWQEVKDGLKEAAEKVMGTITLGMAHVTGNQQLIDNIHRSGACFGCDYNSPGTSW